MTALALRARAAEQAPLWRDLLERARTELLSSRRPELLGLIEEALASTERVEQLPPEDPDHLRSLDVLRELLDRSVSLLPEDAATRDRLGSISSAVWRCREATLDALASAAPRELAVDERSRGRATFRASRGVPALHVIGETSQRAAAVARFDMDRAWDALASGDLDERALDEQLDVSAPTAGAAHLRRLARDCIEEIGALGLLRHHEAGVPWSPSAVMRFEERLLANLDLLAALSRGEEHLDVLDAARRHAAAAYVPDPIRAFAGAFVQGCFDAPGAIGAVVADLRRSHPETHAAQIDALCLASHRGIDDAMRRLADDGDPRWVCAALEVLRFRGTVDFGTAAIHLEHPAPEVRAAAARALTRVPAPAAAVDALEQALAAEETDDVAAELAEALLRLDARTGLVFLRDRLASGAPARELRLLGLAGGAGDRKLLARWVSDEPAYAEALGWYGHAPLLGEHLARLGPRWAEQPEALRSATTLAIARVSGVVLDEQEGPADAAALAHAQAALAGLPADRKLRFGKPFALASSLAALGEDGARGADREAYALEIQLLSGAIVEPADWVLRQRVTIASAERFVAASKAGEWPGDRCGTRRTG